MTEPKPENRPFYWSTVFLRGLWQSGLKHVVLSPGSRSTPLTLAAAALPGLKKHVILDERSAAFIALGIGKATHQPAALVCTSGTAVANYLPAVIEARMSGVPLLLLTADRPPHLHHTSANQTINQQRIFGDYPVFFHDAGEPVMLDIDFNRLRQLAAQAVHYSKIRQGAVHINFPFRKPLEPTSDFVQKIEQENENSEPNSSVKSPKNHIKSFRFDDDILYEIHETKRPLIIVGQLAKERSLKHIFKLSEQLEAPVLSEQGIINAEYAVQGFEGFLRNQKKLLSLEPDLILRFGLQPASKSVLQAIQKWNPTRHIYFSESQRWSDISGSTTDFIEWNGNYFDANKFPKKSTRWLQKWKANEKQYFEESTRFLKKAGALTDGHIYHHLAPKIPRAWSVFISNSFAARDHSMFGRWAAHHPYYINRGASGIDGITSTAMGVNIGSRQPGILFMGDLAFLHDTNALLNHKELESPMVIVVINNQGGSIFRMLPVSNHTEYFNTYFETPQQADIMALAQSYGISATKIETIDQLKKIDFNALFNKSASMLHIIECTTDADASMNLRRKLWDS